METLTFQTLKPVFVGNTLMNSTTTLIFKQRNVQIFLSPSPRIIVLTAQYVLRHVWQWVVDRNIFIKRHSKDVVGISCLFQDCLFAPNVPFIIYIDL